MFCAGLVQTSWRDSSGALPRSQMSARSQTDADARSWRAAAAAMSASSRLSAGVGGRGAAVLRAPPTTVSSSDSTSARGTSTGERMAIFSVNDVGNAGKGSAGRRLQPSKYGWRIARSSTASSRSQHFHAQVGRIVRQPTNRETVASAPCRAGRTALSSSRLTSRERERCFSSRV